MLLVFYHQSPVSGALFSDLKKILENFVKEEGLWLLESLQDALLFSLSPVWEKAQEWVPQVASVYSSSVFETLDIYSVPFRTQQRCGREINWPLLLTSRTVEGHGAFTHTDTE